MEKDGQYQVLVVAWSNWNSRTLATQNRTITMQSSLALTSKLSVHFPYDSRKFTVEYFLKCSEKYFTKIYSFIFKQHCSEQQKARNNRNVHKLLNGFFKNLYLNGILLSNEKV
jgi:aryl-phospho-beta-D-glucosidase BglC (GH1 family)